LARAAGACGLVSPQPAEVEFTILRPFWQRWWFVLVCTLALAAAGYSLHSYRLKHALAVERMRTRIAEDLHDDIGSSLSQIAILSDVAERQPDSGIVPQIASTAREVVDAMNDIV